MSETKEYCAVAIDETQHWELSGDILARAGRIWGIYCYDPGEATYCCELRPSRYLEPLYCIIENELTENETAEIEHEWNLATEPCYMHIPDVDRLPHDRREFDAEDTLDDAREDWCANYWFGPLED